MAIQCFDAQGNEITQFYQWDTNQKLTIKGIPTSPGLIIQFTNSTCDITESVSPDVRGSDLVVEIPNKYLEGTTSLSAFICKRQAIENSGHFILRTLGAIHIPVKPRIRPV